MHFDVTVGWRMIKHRLKVFGKSLIHRQFVFFQRFGVDILPRHFYSEIPAIARLQRTSSWRKPYSMAGVNGADCDAQLAFLRETMRTPLAEQATAYASACADNGAAGYGEIEAEFLLHYIHTHRPQAVIQVGAGVSTSLIRRAARLAGYMPSITCIDPFPTAYLKRLAGEGAITLLALPAEDVSHDILETLNAGDLLFIDSTHTLGPAGEVTRLVLEWLPRLKAGVRVHFHDITFPYDYPDGILAESVFFPHESALLHAFLCLNDAFRIQCSLSMLHHARRNDLTAFFPRYRPRANADGVATSEGHFPSAIYLERVR